MRVPLLDTRLCDLGLTLEASEFRPLVETVRGELARVGIALRPRFYLSTEYGCIVRTQTIGLLWTDGFGFGRRIARAHGLRTRGPVKLLHTLRHEVGHAFCYVHGLYRTARFRRLFGVRGGFFATYPDVWLPRAADRRRVERGEVVLLYATRHPDEDFAVCFQTWLRDEASGQSAWRRRFRGRPIILEKLAYVDEMVRERGSAVPRVTPSDLDEPVATVELTVRDWVRGVLAGKNHNLIRSSTVA